MMLISDFITIIESSSQVGLTFYNSSIDKSTDRSLGIYRRTVSPIVTLGGSENRSYDILPISILVHWTENAESAEDMACYLYDLVSSWSKLTLFQDAFPVKIINMQMLDSGPQWVGRDEKNVCEYTIRANIYYER